MQKTTITFDDGFSHDIYKAGTGPALLFLHGWTSYVEDWIFHIKQLSQKFTCFLWNARCHNQEKVSIARLAQDVLCLIDHFSIEFPSLIGHSMGALTIFELIRSKGCSNLASLVIIDQSPKIITDASWDLGLFRKFDSKASVSFMKKLKNDFSKTVLLLIINSKHRSKAEVELFKKTDFFRERNKYLQSLIPQFWIEIWNDFTIQDYRNILKSIDIPTLLIYGEESKFYGPDVASFMKNEIKFSELHLYSHSGHSPQMEQPEQFITDVESFFGKVL